MAAARQCDRCKQFYTENRKNPRLNFVTRGVGIFRPNFCNSAVNFDFCDSCMNDFLTFVYDYEPPLPDEPEEPTDPENPTEPTEPETPPETEETPSTKKRSKK